MQKEEPEPIGESQEGARGAGKELEGNLFEPPDIDTRPFIEKPTLRSFRRGRWLMSPPPEESDESQIRS